MAQRVAAAAESAGADVRVRHVAETRDPESFAQNPAWVANYAATKDLPAASGDDIVWADAVIFGSPTRFGSPASQLRNFLDSLVADDLRQAGSRTPADDLFTHEKVICRSGGNLRHVGNRKDLPIGAQ